MTQTRILHIIGDGGAGGVQSFLRRVIATSDAVRYRHDVVVLGKPGLTVPALRELGCRVWAKEQSGHLSAVMWISLARFAITSRPDIVHQHGAGRLARAVSLLTGGTPLIVHFHGVPDRWMMDPQLVPYEARRVRSVVRSAKRVMVCSHWLDHEMSRLLGHELGAHVHYYGILDATREMGTRDTLRRSLGIPLDLPIVGFVGRFVPQKGIAHLAKALNGLLSRNRSVHAVVIGDGPELPDFITRLTPETRKRVHLLGERDDAATLMSAFDLLLVTSRWESFGIVAAEAMNAGVPVVAFSVGGLPEVVDEWSGRLVTPFDVPALIDAASSLLESPQLRESVGHHAAERVKRLFAQLPLTRELQQQYDNAMAEG